MLHLGTMDLEKMAWGQRRGRTQIVNPSILNNGGYENTGSTLGGFKNGWPQYGQGQSKEKEEMAKERLGKERRLAVMDS